MRNLSSSVFWIFIFTSTLSFSQNSTITDGASLFGDLSARHIGPALMSGRINDLELHPTNNKIIYLIPYAAYIAACFIIILLLNNTPEEIESNAFVDRYFEEKENNFTTNELLELITTDEIDFKTIVFEDFSTETIFELQQAYDPDFNLIYEDYED